MAIKSNKREAWVRRKERVRRDVSGTAEAPRLSVFRSNKHIYAQVIDDERGMTLASASSMSKELREGGSGVAKTEMARRVGRLAAQRCLAAGITRVVFDRSGLAFSSEVRTYGDRPKDVKSGKRPVEVKKREGRIEALAAAAREVGLKF